MFTQYFREVSPYVVIACRPALRPHWRRNRAWPAALTYNNCCNIRGWFVFYWQSLWFLKVRQDVLFKCLHVATTTTKKKTIWNIHNVCWWSCLVLCGHIMWGSWGLHLVDMCSAGLVLMSGHSGIWGHRYAQQQFFFFFWLASFVCPGTTFLWNNSQSTISEKWKVNKSVVQAYNPILILQILSVNRSVVPRTCPTWVNHVKLEV